MEPVAGEADGGAVEDLPTAGVEVFLGYASHASNVERTFFLDNGHAQAHGGAELKTNDPSF
ncbi:hypothetical protein SSP24_32690 [Streptomyces spinoverrucosus]|uniref:Uncharacterized protein n=1 Tax=Streptomyces spinoverrucosus TaxID=284043 RepID=A0A4Y3VFE6_9ACTN|nr:hypothetical protein SSP24_32690 [Streptomyces spinoverrucosus]GHB77583.1 hypothetical protein GCM10010397_55200 [Streptomyces spinoverrucosus]